MTSIYLNTNHLSQPKVLLRRTQNTPRRCASQDYFCQKTAVLLAFSADLDGPLRTTQRARRYAVHAEKNYGGGGAGMFLSCTAPLKASTVCCRLGATLKSTSHICRNGEIGINGCMLMPIVKLRS